MSSGDYEVNERVLCYHGPMVYEAKVLKAETFTMENTKTQIDGPHYFVHYKGWKQTWDEWVPEGRLLKLDEEGLSIQKELQERYKERQIVNEAKSKQQAIAKASAGGLNASASGSGIGQRGRKEGRGVKRGREEEEGRKPEMRLTVSEGLKQLLVDDWEAVTKNQMLVTLPRSPNVTEVLQDFKQYVEAQGKSTSLRDPTTLLPTIIAGLSVYFDRSLGTQLLYRFERYQYADIRKKYISGQNVVIGQEKEMKEIYGAEHLLRMLVALPTMVAGSAMDTESVNLLRDYVNELLVYMLQERNRIFQPEYENTSSAYASLAQR